MSETAKETKVESGGMTVKVAKEEAPVAPQNELMDILKGLAGSMGDISDRLGGLEKKVKVMESGDKGAFKEGAKEADIASVSEGRSKIDPKVVAIVNEILGSDFGIELKGREDTPGWMFTLVVPDRLSDNVSEKRPILDPEKPGEYKKNVFGDVEYEDYRPEDRRTRAISDADSYTAIKEHCERVRNYIVAYYQTSKKPLPAFKVS